MDKIYLQFAEVYGEVSAMEFELNTKKRTLEEIYAELETENGNDGGYGTDVSAHAFTNIASRLSDLASENPVIYNDVMNSENPSKSLIWPSNMKAFIISMIASARADNHFEIKESKHNTGNKEYHYEIEIKKWSKKHQILVFVAIVESNVIKTGYFNWFNKGDR